MFVIDSILIGIAKGFKEYIEEKTGKG